MKARRRTPITRILCGALTAIVLPSAQAWAADLPVINEFSASTTGTDVEYLEVFGTPSADYSEYWLIEIEGDTTGAGLVDEVIQVGSTDTLGPWVSRLLPNALENGTLTRMALT